jgi:hypothetical protein
MSGDGVGLSMEGSGAGEDVRGADGRGSGSLLDVMVVSDVVMMFGCDMFGSGKTSNKFIGSLCMWQWLLTAAGKWRYFLVMVMPTLSGKQVSAALMRNLTLKGPRITPYTK